MASIVGPKGQIVINKDIRERLGIKPGWIALQRLVDGHVELYFVPPEHDQSLKGSLAAHIKTIVGNESWAEVRALAWETAVRQKEEPPEEDA
ncbi:MAG: AbrB/MazE/SpoVT family DNA-binding domain-containing protein [Roseiflexaceae bacterium]|nr:AbrB/MazE/SpoVT family DNA-binding domain-containing protein [Roseiflexus sp.]MDW8145754.1 AbrB/MazE/SpoVT family DNA-binding domain-containing protein [Roseiflexaceae bacterium]MDW8215696.1 AbrB/MazE/SpoVT family DNA-binding domain-containing protein [Roseiflexaceae bacterium]